MPGDTWYVVLNSQHARILRDLRDTHDPEHYETTMGVPATALRDTQTDRPTRSFASAGGGRRSSVVPHGDPVREETLRFLRDVFDFLERRRMAGAFGQLVMVASPDVTGLWRQSLPAPLHPCIRREVTRNLVNLPSEELILAMRALELD
jgi:protein required for attachment to host cells